MSRTWMYQKVIATPGIGIPAIRIHSVGSAGIQGDAPDVPFITIREMISAPSLLPSFPVADRPYQIWVHDRPGSMTKIDQALEALRNYLPGLSPVKFGNEWIIACEWNGFSDDLYDDHYKTNTRHADFMLKVKGGV